MREEKFSAVPTDRATMDHLASATGFMLPDRRPACCGQQ